MANSVAERKGRTWSGWADSGSRLAEGKPLDLTFFSTGECQHVFNATGEDGGQWVYKIPAAFGHILPVSHEFRRPFRPRRRMEEVIRLALVRMPGALNRLAGRTSAGASPGRGPLRESAASRPLSGAARLAESASERLLLRYVRWERAQRFARMIRILGYMSKHGLDDIPLPYTIIRRGRAVLRVDGSVFSYKGPILVQKRANFFVKSRNFNSFKWDEIIRAQHRLWEHGIALDAPAEVLGPKNWALLDGRLYLADLSGLTTDLDTALRTLRDARLHKKSSDIIREVKAHDPADPAEPYFQAIRQEINQEKLRELWRASARK